LRAVVLPASLLADRPAQALERVRFVKARWAYLLRNLDRPLGEADTLLAEARAILREEFLNADAIVARNWGSVASMAGTNGSCVNGANGGVGIGSGVGLL
jgi:hypothetical protein